MTSATKLLASHSIRIYPLDLSANQQSLDVGEERHKALTVSGNPEGVDRWETVGVLLLGQGDPSGPF